ncbi:hypothetical protein [Motiliproteus sediminis]|uniref:hypothetical protein n=1 Tax=Motiliproteus sediminis TaxID=1468178 RepID=UPI001AEFA0AC|nr:hypothetical protein [Motiliproteus sediminis]
MNPISYTGLADDDRRINRELQAMGAFDGHPEQPTQLALLWRSLVDFMRWMRWKAEISANGCRLGVSHAVH